MITLEKVAQVVDGVVRGDSELEIFGVGSLENGKPGTISFVSKKAFVKHLSNAKVTAVLVNESVAEKCSMPCVIVKDPYLAYAKVAQIFESKTLSDFFSVNQLGDSGIKVGMNCNIDESVRLGRNVVIGNNVTIYPNVTLYEGTTVGDGSVIHSGSVIGADGFGYAPSADGWEKIPQLSTVVIGKNVEIGANATIDRGALHPTKIGDGVKIDNLVMVAHGVCIGEQTAIAAQVGIAGSTVIGKRCTLAGKVGVVGHLNIVDDVHVTAQSLVTHSIHRAGVYSSGTPLMPNSEWKKNAARFKKLDYWMRALKKIERFLKLKN